MTKFKLCLLFITLIVFISNNTHAQKLKKLIENGDKFVAENNFLQAEAEYKKAILKDSSDIALQYKFAEINRLNKNNNVALHWYKKVYFKDKAGLLYPQCLFWIASLKKREKNYAEAKVLFNKYAEINKKNKDNYYYKKAKQETMACEQAIWLTNNPDKSIILYTLSNTADTNAYKQNEVVFNADSTKKYCSVCESVSSCKIYESEYKNNNWLAFKALPDLINTPGTMNKNPAIGYLNQQEVLFFSSNRNGGEGGMDIWYSKINNKTYSKPINAGKNVNSIDDEITPFFCNPCQELFFSSNWHKGLGGFDIFKCDFTNNAFSIPHNMGIPINSSADDSGFTIDRNKNQIRFYSNRNNENTYSDEYKTYAFNIPGTQPLQKNANEKTTDSSAKSTVENYLPLTLYFHNDEPDANTLATETKKNYENTVVEYLKMEELYKQEFLKTITPNNTEKAKKELAILFTDSIKGGMEKLNQITNTLVPLVMQGKTISIYVKGFCSPLATTQYNQNLAKRRISSVKNYFSAYKNGILKKYINNLNKNEGCILFYADEIGELKAKPTVSDNYYDTANSIYNPNAALERKIQIVSILVK